MQTSQPQPASQTEAVVPCLGLDFNRVIIDDKTELIRTGKLNVSSVPGAFEAVARLVQLFGSENCFVITNCNPKAQNREIAEQNTYDWLYNNDFFGKTGFCPENVFFSDDTRTKAMIAEDLRINYFVDDKVAVLGSMTKVLHRILFNPRTFEMELNRDLLSGDLHIVKDWQEAFSHIQLSLSANAWHQAVSDRMITDVNMGMMIRLLKVKTL